MKLTCALLAIGSLAANLFAGSDQHPQANPELSLKLLAQGNRRYVAGKPSHPHQSRTLRTQLSAAQHPFAAILSCADSRVPPELIFDEGLGDLFVVRVAGNIVDDAVTGSLEYAAEHLHVPLIVVLGHTRCGAVDATIKGGDTGHSHIEALVKAIRPAVEQASHESGSLIYNAVRDNVAMSVKQLRESQPILSELEKEGKLKVVGAIYDIEKGTVEYLR